MSMIKQQRSSFQNGFSLFEVAAGVLILGIVLLSFSGIFSLLFESNNQTEEKQNIKRIHDSINTYLSVNAYLPCPDTDTPPDGAENRTDSGGISVCTDREGGLPYSDLGVDATDAWGNAYYYRVHQRAESATYINEICQTASVLGKSGTKGITDLWMCPATNQFYCGTQASCNAICSDPSVVPTSTTPTTSEFCSNTIDPRPATAAGSPYFHLATPPFGSVAGSFNLLIEDEAGVQLGEGVVAVVVSWGANGHIVNRDNCTGGTAAELENCNDDRTFVDTQTGADRDFIRWVTVNQAKVAIIGTGELR